MKIFKRFICALIIAVFAFAFVGCGDETPRLATPQNVTASETGLITWDAVENADNYILILNGRHYDMKTSTQYQVGSTVNDFTYAVYARGEGYLNSTPSETQTFKGTGIPLIIDTNVKDISIKGKQLVGSGRDTTLTAAVNYIDGNTTKAVTWSIVDGEEYCSIDASTGKFTAKTVTEDHDVTVRATSVANQNIYAELVICVAVKPELTDELLATVQDNYIGFEGYMDIDLYSFGLNERYVSTVNIYGISTQMNGERWHASYVDNDTGFTSEISYRKVGDVAQQVAISLTNEEEYYPMTDDNGNIVSWTDAGLYNSFIGMKPSDFTFDEDEWRWYYTGPIEVVQKMISSASPYEFDAKRFGLIIEDGELLGIYAESNPSLTVVQNYKAVEKFYSYINVGEENVEVPLIGRFEHNPATTGGGHIDHDTLDTAIRNMQALENYKIHFKISSYMATGHAVNGFYETVMDGDYFFQPYDGNEVEVMQEGAEYGYHKISDTVYNSYNYDPELDKYIAARAFNGNMDNAKPSFEFASEIFTSWQYSTESDVKIYYVDQSMCHVATTFYYGVGNDMPLYGLFAMYYENFLLGDYTPYVVVENGYITETGFFYFLGDMYGEVRVYYSEFNTATMPDAFRADLFENGNYVQRRVPSSWLDHSVSMDVNSETGINASVYFTEMFGLNGVKDLPYFGELLGDTFGFAVESYHSPGGVSYQVKSVALYYDVSLDADRTINQTIKATQDYLVQQGFTRNMYGEYVKGDVTVLPYDSSLDFLIYVWKTV